MSFNPLLDGIKIKIGMDLFATSFAPNKLADIYYDLSASQEDRALLCESADFAEMDDFFNPGPDMILEAITVKRFSQVESKMAALVRVLNKHGQNGITAGDAIIGKPKKSGLFATVTVQVPLSDGQTISIIFHSPSGDDRKIMPDDTIVAFMWRLNKRDITHAVSPERGRDVSLEQVCQRVMQIAAKNSDAFQAAQEKVKADQTELTELTTQIKTMQTTNDEKLAELTNMQETEADLDSEISDVQVKVDALKTQNAELQKKIDAIKAEKAAEEEAAAKIASQELKNLPDGWEGVQTSLGWTYVKTFGDETIGVEVTPRDDDTFNVETVSKGGSEREGHFIVDDMAAAHANALENMNAIDQAHPPVDEGGAGGEGGGEAGETVKFDHIKATLVIGEFPWQAKPGDLIFNAPRPIYGHREWMGDFVHGAIYTGVDPKGERAAWMIEENRSLAAWLLEYRTKEQVVDIAKRWFADEYPEYAESADEKYEDDQYIDSLRNHLDQKAKTYGELKAFLAKYEGAGEPAEMSDSDTEPEKFDFQAELDAATAEANPGYDPKESVQHIEKIVKAYGGAVSWKITDYESFENIFYGEITHPDSGKIGFTAITYDGKAVFGVDGARIRDYYATADDETQEAAIDAMFKLMLPQVVAVQPVNDQDGMPAKRAAKLLIAHGLDMKVMTEEVQKVIANGAYQDLVIEAHPHLDGSKNRQIMFTQNIEEGGDKIIDSEVIFAVNPYVGLLKLDEIGYRGPMGEVRRRQIGRPEKSWANTFTKNLIDQGFERAGAEPEPEDFDPTTPENYRKVMADKDEQVIYQDILDSFFNTRYFDVRNALRKLGWEGEIDGKLSKNGYALNPIIKKVGAGGNVVGIDYKIDGVPGFFMSDTLQNTAEELARKIDLGLPVVVEPESAHTYSEWEGAVIDAIENTLDVTRSDAQGIVEAQQEAMQKAFNDGLSAVDAAALIGSLWSTREEESTPELEPEPEEETMPEQPEAVHVANDFLAGKYDEMNPAAIADLIEPVFDLPENQYLELMEKVDVYATELAKKAAA